LNFNIAQLERILDDRRTEVSRLERQRAELAASSKASTARSGSSTAGSGGCAGGYAAAGGGGRARNERSLVETLEAVMRSNGKPMRVGDIVEAVTATGYRSNSANFRGIINQTLIKERKRFGQADRGVYELKGGGESKAKKDKPAA
jgi:hypothetical protein